VVVFLLPLVCFDVFASNGAKADGTAANPLPFIPQTQGQYHDVLHALEDLIEFNYYE